MIVPTVGRIVLYHPGPDDPASELIPRSPQAAIICYVWNDTNVNLCVFDSNGAPYPRTSVYLLQEEPGPNVRPHSQYAEWMPYQQAVAKGEIPPTLHAEPK